MNRQILRNIVFTGLFLIPFVPFLVSSSFFFPFITTKAFAFRIIVEVVFTSWVVLAIADPAYRPRRSKIFYALMAFIAIIGLADIFGVQPVKSFWSNAERMEGFVALLHFGMFYTVIVSVFKEIDWKRWWTTFLGASLLMVIYCIFQLLGVLQIHQGGARVDGTLGNAAYLAVYLLFNIFMALFFLVRNKEKNLKWLYLSVIISESAILYFTATRGAILGLLGGLLIVSLLGSWSKEDRFRKWSRAYLLGFVILIAGFFAFRNTSFFEKSPVLARFANASLAEWKTEGRAFVWPMALEGVKERPILGWGQENFNYVFNEHYSAKMFKLEPWFDRAHNIFLDWAIAGGLLGLISYLSLYVLLLLSLWKGKNDFSFSEKSILTGLLSAYFFHNLFVFDHLISYILFISLLAFVDTHSGERNVKEDWNERSVSVALPIVGVAFLAFVYFINVRPMIANSTLISALKNLQAGNQVQSIEDFEKAYSGARLGRPEIVEQIASNATAVLGSNIPIETRNNYFLFARGAVEGQAQDSLDDARYQLLAGTFLDSTGQFEAANVYLRRAVELMPEKQAMYFELATNQIAQNKRAEALATLKYAYDLAPEYPQAKSAYLVGAIYAGDIALEDKLLSEIPVENLLSEGQVFAAMYQNGQSAKLLSLLRDITQKFPEHAARAEDYIKQIQSLSR